MSETLDLTTLSDEPVESNVQVEITDADPEEPVEEEEEPVETESHAEAPVVDEEPEEAPEEVSEPVEAEEETTEVTPEVVEEPEEPIAVEEPVEEAPVEEVVSEEPVETAGPTEEAPVAPVEQVAADIRNILTEVPSTTPVEFVESVEPLVTDNLCSLKTLVDVLGKWSGNEIRRRQVEDLLKEGTDVDENLDDIEKVVEVLKLWIGEGGSTFREHNHFKKLDEYTLSGESRNLSEEKKVEVLKTLTDLVVTVLQRRVSNEYIQNVINNIY